MKICEHCGDWSGNAYERCVACGAQRFFPYSPPVQYWHRWDVHTETVTTSLARLPVEPVSPRG
ncbi:MAG TPA: hypothetical protein VFX21_12520 [Acidimicrobiia bacterium]|nr:hypothetical protein [Acidimicrobiia bacterium]